MSNVEAARARKIEEAATFLRSLNFDAERSNERSALVFLALADIRPDTPWRDASAPMIGVTPIMDWLAKHYGKVYKPNTRETVRRRTLHQFVGAGLVAENPNEPGRPPNSPKWCYQLQEEALALVQTIGEPGHEDAVSTYLDDLPGMLAAYEAAREIERVPVTLPNGESVALSPGGQNLLIRDMVHEFCPRFTPGGEVLYIGDAARGDEGVYEKKVLAALGVTLHARGKMPDLIVYVPDRNWLVLLEAASSHGPVDFTRHAELKTLFADSTAGLVFVSCFPTRAHMRQYLHEIAWETDVWCAEHPDHLIHFNGERFLGPYGH